MSKNYSRNAIAAYNGRLYQQELLANQVPENERQQCGFVIKVAVSIEPDSEHVQEPFGQCQIEVKVPKVKLAQCATRGDLDKLMADVANQVELKLHKSVNEAAKKAFAQTIEVVANTYCSEGVPPREDSRYNRRTPETRRIGFASTFGYEDIYLRRTITQDFTSNKFLETNEYVAQLLQVTAATSFENTAQIINRVQSRYGNDRVRKTTIHLITTREGNGIERRTRAQSKAVLAQHHFDTSKLDEDPGAVKPTDETDLASILGPQDGFNSARNGAVSICADCVCTKRQKPKRSRGKRGRAKKRGKGKSRNWLTTLTIQAKGCKPYYVVARTKEEAFARALVVLVENNLLYQCQLILFVDGEQALVDVFNRVFAFVPCREVKLDWWHLRKRVKDDLSRSISGTAADKQKVLKQAIDYVWSGERYQLQVMLMELLKLTKNKSLGLDNELLDENIKRLYTKQPEVIRSEVIKGLIKYLDNKSQFLANYAALNRMGLKLSSNTAEGANRVLVSARQKRNGTSWTQDGCGTALAFYYTAKLNYCDKDKFDHHKITLTLRVA